MANQYFKFKQFTIHQDSCAMKITTDSCLFGAWISPNPLTEELKVFDIGTGTGLLSLMFMQKYPEAIIDAIEIDNAAYEQARENIAASPWPRQVNVIHGDASEFINPAQYDVIISNPPFYENELKSGNSKKNRAHHDEGLLFDDLLKTIRRNLKPGGQFYLLLPYKRNNEIQGAFAKNKLSLTHTTLVRQTTNHPYSRIMLSGKLQEDKNENFATSELIIKNDINEYAPEFTNLLKGYYLYL